MSTRSGGPQPTGVVLILIATAGAGGAAYLLTPLVAARLGGVGYAAFAVFWSGLYLVVSALSGVQQEVSRATRPRPAREGGRQRKVALNFASFGAFFVLAVMVSSAFLWVSMVFPQGGWDLVWPLAFGVASYVLVAVLSGVLYGLQRWRFIALMIGVDGVLRTALVLTVLAFTSDLTTIAWAVAVPFILTPLILWPFFGRQVRRQFELDVGYQSLSWNVAQTVAGSASTGVLVSGFPLLLGATSGQEPAGTVGALVLAITLTRAPIIIVVLSLQSYLIIFFRSHARDLWPALARIAALIAVLTGILAALVYWLGSWALTAFVGPDFDVGATVLALLVLSAGLVAGLCATGPAVLSRSDHGYFTAGWFTAAAATVVLLLLPGTLEMRALIALAVGPVLGLTVHLVGLRRGDRAAAGADQNAV